MALPGRLRLRERRRIREVAQGGRRVAGRALWLRLLPGETAWPRLCLSCSRKVGGAVVRNRLRRRLHEVFRARVADGGAAWDMLLSLRPEAATLTSDELGGSLEELLHRAGVVE